MMRATLKMTQRALIANNPVKNRDCPRLVLKELKSPLYTAGHFGSFPFTLCSTRFYSLNGNTGGGGGGGVGDGDGGNAAKASSLSGFAAPNLGSGIIGGNASSVTDATGKVMGSGGGNNDNKDHEGSSANAEILFKKDVATSEMAADQTIIRPGKLGAAEPIETFKSAEPPTRGKAGSSGSGSSGDESKPKGFNTAGPSSLNEAVNMANKQIQEIIANSPDKEQVEKYFFRVVAFIYDLTYLMATWAVRFVEQNIVQNKTVQHYWKRFHEKMEQAKKD